MEYRLHPYLNEIWDIAAANNVDVSVGRSMFLRNVYDGKETYKGAKDPVNWAELQPHYGELCKSSWNFNRAQNKYYSQIVKLRNQGKRAEAAVLVVNFKGK